VLQIKQVFVLLLLFIRFNLVLFDYNVFNITVTNDIIQFCCFTANGNITATYATVPDTCMKNFHLSGCFCGVKGTALSVSLYPLPRIQAPTSHLHNRRPRLSVDSNESNVSSRSSFVTPLGLLDPEGKSNTIFQNVPNYLLINGV